MNAIQISKNIHCKICRTTDPACFYTNKTGSNFSTCKACISKRAKTKRVIAKQQLISGSPIQQVQSQQYAPFQNGTFQDFEQDVRPENEFQTGDRELFLTLIDRLSLVVNDMSNKLGQLTETVEVQLPLWKEKLEFENQAMMSEMDRLSDGSKELDKQIGDVISELSRVKEVLDQSETRSSRLEQDMLDMKNNSTNFTMEVKAYVKSKIDQAFEEKRKFGQLVSPVYVPKVQFQPSAISSIRL